MKGTPVLALKMILRGGGGIYFGALCHGYALNCHFDYLGIPGTRPLLIQNHNLFVLFIYTEQQKVKLTSVQINMKQVLYSLHTNQNQLLNLLPHRGAFCKQGRPRSGSSCKSCLIRVYLFVYGNMVRYNPTLVDLTSNFFVLY